MDTMTENNLNFNELPPYQKRQFVSEDADLTSLKEIGALFEQLSAEDIQSSEELERWILSRSELEAALDQQGSILYIRMTCQTDDTVRVQSYKNFIETIVPAVKLFEDQLNKKYWKGLERFPLKEGRYDIYTRTIRTDI